MKTSWRVPLRVAVPVLLMAIVAVLAALQYRWLGQVSQAERARMHETMTARVQAMADDLDREIARVYVAFQIRSAEIGALDEALTLRYRMWRDSGGRANLVRNIYLARGDGSLERFDPARGTLTPIDWPGSLEPIRTAHVRLPMPPQGTATVTFRFPQAITPDPLAIAVMLPFELHRSTTDATGAHVTRAPGFVLLTIDEQVMAREVLPALAAEHLGDSLSDYRLAVVGAGQPPKVIYQPAGSAPLAAGEADVRVDALGLRAPIVERVIATELRATAAYAAGLEASRGTPAPPPPPTDRQADRFAVVVQPAQGAPATAGAGPRTGRLTALTRTAAYSGGAWQVLLKHRAGSLEAAVQQVRRRNLVMSFGMLALLAMSVGLVLVSARRAERLASQQMDFVATVSHELRTPLAVIRSAGQNLAAGVVHDTKRYGALVEAEGKRLTDMVEQTLALAGLSGGRRPAAQQPLDAGDLVRGVVASPETSSQAGDVEFEVRVAEELPLVQADEMLLRRGVQNLIANALKYGRPGGWVGVTVDAHGWRPRAGAGWTGDRREVRIAVSDRGPGVAAEDLPHIFEPFYRGRRAVADQVQGNGLGLHLVKRIAEAHGGRVTVRSTPGAGATFVIHIPASGDPALQPLRQPQRTMERRAT